MSTIAKRRRAASTVRTARSLAVRRPISSPVLLVVMSAVLLLPGGFASAMTSASGTVTVPPSIPSDCSVDTTDQLGTWIASVPDGSTMVLAPGGCYRLDGTLKIEDRSNLTIDGAGATLKAYTLGDLTRRHVIVRSGDNITIKNLNVIGSNADAGLGDRAWNKNLAFQHGFTLQGVQTAVLDNVSVSKVWGDFVYIGAADLIPSSNIQVINSFFDGNGRQGICITSAEHVLIANNTIANVRMTVIDLEPQSLDWHVLDVTVRDNVLGPRRLTLLSAATRGHVDQVSFLNNQVIGTLRTVVESRATGIRYSQFLFEGNVASQRHAGAYSVLKFRNVDDVTLNQNTQRVAGMPFVGLSGSCHAVVNYNTIVGASAAINADDTSCDYSATGNVFS